MATKSGQAFGLSTRRLNLGRLVCISISSAISALFNEQLNFAWHRSINYGLSDVLIGGLANLESISECSICER